MDGIGDLFWPLVALIHLGVGMVLHEAGLSPAAAVCITCAVSLLCAWRMGVFEGLSADGHMLVLSAYVFIFAASAEYWYGLSFWLSMLCGIAVALLALLALGLWAIKMYCKEKA